MRLQDISTAEKTENTNLYVGYNETEDFRILIEADSTEAAKDAADSYAEDSGLDGEFSVEALQEKHYAMCFDCDYTVSSSDNA